MKKTGQKRTLKTLWQQWQKRGRWLVRAALSCLLVVTLFSSMGLTAQNFGVPPGEIAKIVPKESMSDCSRAYEQQVTTGRGPDEGYVVGIPKRGRRSDGVKFDGYDEATGTLQDAKGLNYKVNNDGTWSSGKVGRAMQRSAIRKAERQKEAANLAGKKVKWILAEEKYLKAFGDAVKEAGAEDTIDLEYQPPSDEVKKKCKKRRRRSTSSH